MFTSRKEKIVYVRVEDKKKMSDSRGGIVLMWFIIFGVAYIIDQTKILY